jgi:DNA-binding beta-propeller fold protein YncE
VVPGEALPRVKIVGETGGSPGQFLKPRGMDADSWSLWVVDKTARIQRIDPETGAPLSVWSTPESAAGKPVGLTVIESAIGAGGEVIATPERPLVFVADTHYHRVLVYRAPAARDQGSGVRGQGWDAPELVGEFGSYGRGPGEFIYPTDVVVLQDADGRIERIIVSEYGGNDRIQIFDGRYQVVGELGRFGPGEDPKALEFNRPQSIDIDPASGDLLVADAGNHRIGRMSLDGELRGWLDGTGGAEAGGGEFGQLPGLQYPYGVLALGDGTALVAEYGRNQVRRIDLDDGRTLGAWGRAGREPGELMTPWAVAVRGGIVYVLDTGHDRVQAFRGGVRARSRR